MASKRRITVGKVLPLIALGYVGVQVYAVARAYAWFELGPWSVVWLAAFVLLMTYTPMLLRRVENRGWHYTAEALAWAGYTWMGFAFLFFWIALGLELLGWLATVASATTTGSWLREFPTALGVTLAVTAYGLLDARRVRVERVQLKSPKVSKRARPYRVALISDVHLGVLVGPRRLRRMVERLRTLDADVVLSAGDLVDGQADRVSLLVPLLDALQPRDGKFAVTGNHDYYVGIEHALDFHARAGFHVLSGTAAEVGDDIRIAGVDDPTSKRLGMWSNVDERVPLDAVSRDRFTILLKHQPIVEPRAAGMFDLQLSGHVHRGQIFPFNWLVRLVYPVRTGLSRLAGGGWLYVSRGTGTWGPPMRVGAAPEITLIEIAAA